MKNRFLIIAMAFLSLFGVAACSRPADRASHNLSVAADNFEINRRVVFYNGITDEVMLEVVGRCSLGNYDSAGQLTVTCKIGDDQYVKHFLGLSDNVTFFVEQINSADVSTYTYDVRWRPTTILPDVSVDVGVDD